MLQVLANDMTDHLMLITVMM